MGLLSLYTIKKPQKVWTEWWSFDKQTQHQLKPFTTVYLVVFFNEFQAFCVTWINIYIFSFADYLQWLQKRKKTNWIALLKQETKWKLHALNLVELIRYQCHSVSKWNAAVKISFEVCYRVAEHITLLLVSVPVKFGLIIGFQLKTN